LPFAATDLPSSRYNFGMPEMALNIEVARQAQKEDRNVIIRGLLEYNHHYLGESAALDVYVRDAEGQVVGGLVGDASLGWFSIHALWVEEQLRGSGLGTSILKAAEDAAFKSGCHSVLLDTLSFQAPDFYEKRGYVRVGVVEGFRGGTQKLFLQKRLRAQQ
jgi:GNAT superfamily N-acetyltransferase